MAEHKPPMVVVIAGPTASGKSDVAARICKEQKGLIVSADSVQAYRGVQIGANKPSADERAETPHLLIDVADHLENYNAAEWRDDAIFCIQTLLLREDRDDDALAIATETGANPFNVKRRKEIQETIQQTRIAKGYGIDDFPVLPVVCGGTMMYLQWLVHGRPDAMRPTSTAIKKSHEIIQQFQNAKNYRGAVDYVSSFDSVFEARTRKFCGEDWYRLRRTLEVALTVQEQSAVRFESGIAGHMECDTQGNAEKQFSLSKLVENLYSGQRQGSLSSLGYDVRCFFLCPDDRMGHTRVIDERCEQMLIKGLIRETTDLSLSGCLPEMAERAIGYRQTLDYLRREKSDDETEENLFDFFLNEFTTATRRYAKKQMAWFRKDNNFIFVPVPLKIDKQDRVDIVAKEINRLCQLSLQDYERELYGRDNASTKCKTENESQ
jgi:tRNA dimethylallyltransferase